MHLSPEVALDFAEARLSTDEAAFWKRHLKTCTDCAQVVDRWRQLEIDLKRSHLKSAADDDLQKVIQIFPHRADEGTTRASARFWLLLFSIVIFSRRRLVYVEAWNAARQLVLRAKDFDIHVKIWGEVHRKQMLGQLLSRGGENLRHIARFHLLQNGERLETTATNEMGEFHFTDVPEGDLSLQLIFLI